MRLGGRGCKLFRVDAVDDWKVRSFFLVRVFAPAGRHHPYLAKADFCHRESAMVRDAVGGGVERSLSLEFAEVRSHAAGRRQTVSWPA